MKNYNTIQDLLRNKTDLETRLKFLPYDGTPEIKTIGAKKYLYIRKRVFDKVKSTYVDVYSDDLYNLLVRNNKVARELRKQIRLIDRQLAELDYSSTELSSKAKLCIDFARKNRNVIIYDQAILEGIATTFPDTEEIIENGRIKNASTNDVQKLLNLKHAWEFILDENVLQSPSDYDLSSYVAKLVNEGFYQEGGRIRGVPVKIGGTSYIPPLPIEQLVKEEFNKILSQKIGAIDIAIELCLYIMKTQVYNDGNKRTAVIVANHYLIAKGIGLLIIDAKNVSKFKKLLINFYEGTDVVSIKKFLHTCVMTIK
ncbi:MAG: Fic family protein [Bacilli bacterium]|nr:Fic family protein [Bacilli bacterium]